MFFFSCLLSPPTVSLSAGGIWNRFSRKYLCMVYIYISRWMITCLLPSTKVSSRKSGIEVNAASELCSARVFYVFLTLRVFFFCFSFYGDFISMMAVWCGFGPYADLLHMSCGQQKKGSLSVALCTFRRMDICQTNGIHIMTNGHLLVIYEFWPPVLC